MVVLCSCLRLPQIQHLQVGLYPLLKKTIRVIPSHSCSVEMDSTSPPFSDLEVSDVGRGFGGGGGGGLMPPQRRHGG